MEDIVLQEVLLAYSTSELHPRLPERLWILDLPPLVDVLSSTVLALDCHALHGQVVD